MRQDIIYNGINGNTLGVYAIERPALPVAEKRREIIEVAGRDGVLTIGSGDYMEKEISVKLNFMAKIGKWNEQCQKIKEWLAEEQCKLQFSDDMEHFYRIIHTKIKDVSRPSERVGVLEATFVTRDGLRYLESGKNEVRLSTSGTQLNNPYVRSYPTFKITGNSMFTIEITKGSVTKKMTGQVSGDITIDTENMLAYRNDGTSQNRLVTGDYADLWLEKGNNIVKISSGVTATITPNWRCL